MAMYLAYIPDTHLGGLMHTDRIDDRRRKILTVLGGAASLGLAGCCTHRPAASPPSFKASSPREYPILVPWTDVDAFSRSSPVIDAHGHFFNGTDASVADYLVHSIGHDSPYQPILESLRPIVNRLICLAPTAAAEYEDLVGLSRQLQGQAPDAIRIELKRSMQRTAQQVGQELYKEIDKDSALVARIRAAMTAEGHKRVAFSQEFVLAAVDPFDEVEKDNTRDRLSVTMAGILNFVFCFLRPRWQNLQQYRKRYEEVGVVAVADAMVNFNGWYAPAISPAADQMKLHALMARLSGGYNLPLIAFNPWSDDSDANLTLVKQAIQSYGFVGVKIYPPMGFWLANNAGLPKYPGERPNLAQLDRRLRDLFDFCISEDVPVLLHANSSMGPNGGADNYGGPAGLAQLVEQYKHATKAPKIILGHFGGDANPKDTQIHDLPWPAHFADIMVGPGGGQVYGDMSMWTDLAQCQTNGQCNALKRLEFNSDQHKQVSQRLLYGSDWFMLVKHKHWETFPEIVRTTIGRTYPMDRVMYKNSLDCFGLNPQDKAFQRIQAHLGHAPFASRTRL